ncbi:MAG TPA: hypothetical protein VGJ09_07240 [Bryobacteraceae bacterium]|jgi:hypothetical protein
MKSKKAVKRLTRVEKLLSEVQSEYSSVTETLGKALTSAKAAIAGIKAGIAKAVETKDAKPKAGKSAKSGKSHEKSAKKAAPAKVVKAQAPAKRKRASAKRSASAGKPPKAAVRSSQVNHSDDLASQAS